MVKKPKTSSKLRGLLKKANGKYKKVDPAAGSGFVNDAVEDGSYDSVLTGAEAKEMGGKAVIVFEYTIADGEDCEGEKISQRYFLESDQNLAFFKRDLGKFVDDPDEVDLEKDLEETLSDLVEAEPACRITVKMKDEYQNVYLNKVDVEGGNDDDSEDDDEDEAPKKKPGKGGKKKPAADDEDDDNDDDSPEIEEGDRVLFTPPRAKKAKEFEVVSIKKGKATLEDDDGNELKGILVDKLELVDSDNDDDSEDDDEDEAPKKKPGKGGKGGGKGGKKSGKGSADDDDEDDDSEDDVEIDVGSKVSVNFKGKEYAGKVTELDEDEEKVQVKFKGPDGKSVEKWFAGDKVEAA